MFCKQCGKEVKENAEFCANCGAKLDSEKTEMRSDGSRKVLTYDMIRIELDGKISKGNYIFPGICLGWGVILMLCGVAPGLVFVVIGIIGMISTFNKHKGYCSNDFRIEEQECIKKTFKIDPDEYGLVFIDRCSRKKVYLEVSEWECDEAEVGEEFYLVFLGKKKSPCLHYSKKHWILEEQNCY